VEEAEEEHRLYCPSEVEGALLSQEGMFESVQAAVVVLSEHSRGGLLIERMVMRALDWWEERYESRQRISEKIGMQLVLVAEGNGGVWEIYTCPPVMRLLAAGLESSCAAARWRIADDSRCWLDTIE
jgi:hypothetical protein